MRRATLLVFVLSLAAALAPLTAFAQGAFGPPPWIPIAGQVVYDSTVIPTPGNLPSVGAEAYAFNEFGDEIVFAGSSRFLQQVTLTLSSWACENGRWYTNDCSTSPGATFQIPITLNLYNVGANDSVGTLITSMTETFNVPFRPSADPIKCSGGEWFQASSGTCFNGLAANITFDFSTQGLQLPDSVIYGVTYNTSHYGPSPVGQAAACYSTSAGCPYDSLNIALSPQVTVGSQANPGTVFQNSPYGSEYCDHGAAGHGTFRLDSPSSACWTGYVPAVQFTTTSVPGSSFWNFVQGILNQNKPPFHH